MLPRPRSLMGINKRDQTRSDVCRGQLCDPAREWFRVGIIKKLPLRLKARKTAIDINETGGQGRWTTGKIKKG